MTKEKDAWINLLSDEQRFELAKISIQASMPLIDSFANTGIKVIMMLNGGAAIAILAFLGNIIITDYSKWIYGIVWALGGYAIGAACSAIVAFLAYVSQSEYNTAIDKRGDCFRTKAMLIAAIGIILFVTSTVIVGITIRCY
ncbi:hypothetical protein [Veillonella magna]|uniref:Transmembrane protein n=1 Tax=Veillonella magna TaxID=464322 RepID=A0ABS2GK71_9FIRM|nr:hypothetical protein [Veillonella magna]MBM6825367.1 hypothetical protein [Veillonella magna]MBM6913662.1 hypothetical protein [Veillonella magna]